MPARPMRRIGQERPGGTDGGEPADVLHPSGEPGCLANDSSAPSHHGAAAQPDDESHAIAGQLLLQPRPGQEIAATTSPALHGCMEEVRTMAAMGARGRGM